MLPTGVFMSFSITDIFTSGVGKVVDSVGNALDKLVTSDQEREMIKNELEKIKLNAILETENNYLKHEEEITKRWQSDNEHVITRSVRPGIVIWSFILLSIAMLFDGNSIYGFTLTIKEAYIPILETIVVTVVIAYFGSRGVEKTAKHIRNKE